MNLIQKKKNENYKEKLINLLKNFILFIIFILFIQNQCLD
jgi:hypothetical protein